MPSSPVLANGFRQEFSSPIQQRYQKNEHVTHPAAKPHVAHPAAKLRWGPLPEENCVFEHDTQTVQPQDHEAEKADPDDAELDPLVVASTSEDESGSDIAVLLPSQASSRFPNHELSDDHSSGDEVIS